MAWPDTMATKLRTRYPGTEINAGALLQRYRADNALTVWEEFVAHIAAASPEFNVGDDEEAFWAAFVP